MRLAMAVTGFFIHKRDFGLFAARMTFEKDTLGPFTMMSEMNMIFDQKVVARSKAVHQSGFHTAADFIIEVIGLW